MTASISPIAPKMPESTAERRLAYAQAIASTRIEGHEPAAEFLADVQQAIDGQLSDEQLIERAIARGQSQSQGQDVQAWLRNVCINGARMSTDEAYRQQVNRLVS